MAALQRAGVESGCSFAFKMSLYDQLAGDGQRYTGSEM